ncbi:uncharacterized protein LOC126887224 isoform X5 [Diabrotica virgifera virgifera]|uniref:Cysteine proteinase CG12163 n=1 Tax=Diabrotica virgifera virgifera TaxID=50390 RepID=A0ABM5KK55_DIAVI|nr:uncharacterized protein LOC126887224 isoform X5 [Diabrotica virgifera virgifera]
MIFKQLLLLVFCVLGALGQVVIDSGPPNLYNYGNIDDVQFDNEPEPEPVQTKVGCAGCPTDIDPKADGVQKLVNAALSHIESERDTKHVAVKVLRVQTQVVAGIKYILSVEVASTSCPKNTENLDCSVQDSRVCDVEYLEQPWLGVSKIISNTCTKSQEFDLKEPIDPPPPKKVHRELEPDFLSDLESQIIPDSPKSEKENSVQFDDVVESKPCLGCLTEVDVNDKVVPFLVNAALSHIESEDKVQQALIQVLRVQSQVVAGIKYKFLVEVAPTVCPAEPGAKPCYVDRRQNSRVCEVEYWEKAWLGFKKIVSNNCTKSQEFEPLDLEPNSVLTVEHPLESKLENAAQFDNEPEPEPVQTKVGCAGCPTDIDPKAEGVQKLVNAALRHIESERDTKHVAVKVLRVQTQVVAGIKYILSVEVASTSCPKNSENLDCSIQDSRVCDVEYLEQPWLGVSKIISNTCTKSQEFDLKEPIDPPPPKKVHRKLHPDFLPDLESQIIPDSPKSEKENSVQADDIPIAEPEAVQRVEPCAGCPTDVDPKAEGVEKLVNAALRHIDSEHDFKHVAVKVLRVQQQVVAGVKYTLLVEVVQSSCRKEDSEPSCSVDPAQTSSICEVEYLEQRWLDISKIIKNNCTISQEFDVHETIDLPQESVVRQEEPDFLSDLESQIIPDTRSSKKSSVKIDSPVVKELLEIAANHLGYENSQIVTIHVTDLDPHYYMLDVIFEKNRVYAECLVYMKLNDVDTAQSTVDKVKCVNQDGTPLSRHVRQVPGGISPISKDDPKVKRYLKDGLLHLDKESSHEFKFKVVEILEVSRQVVSGSLHRIKAKIALSDCKKESNIDASQCGVQANGQSTICDFKVWDQPWIEHGRETNITCHDDSLVKKQHHSFRLRRSLDDNDVETILSSVFEHFLAKYDKKYRNVVEHKYRFGVFKENLKLIHLLNKHEQGTAVYKITKFADMTSEEFSASHGYRSDLRSENEIPFHQAKIPEIDLPTSFDWRDKNAVTEVKDQGMCGSCWAFSTTGNVEGQYAIKYKKLQSFSEQELVDCDKLDDGCNGGLMDNAYRTIEKLGGLELEREYPYEGVDEKCHFNKTEAVVRLSGALNISHDETDMAKWLTQNGPISIAINANAMQFYAGGVSHPFKVLCNPKNLDHGVLIVGYGVHTTKYTKKQVPYWIVKNSWGKSWGEQGYYRVYRGDGTCGLNQTPSSGIVA